MIDRAEYDPRLIATAQSMRAEAIGGYAFDHYLADVGGFCGGWTPDAVATIYAAGLDYRPIFVMRDGEPLLDPSVCVDILHRLGVRPGAWVHADIERGAAATPAWVANLNAAVKQAGFHAAPYGTASTLNSGYLGNADAPWVAGWLGLPWDSALQATLANMPNVGVWQYAQWQYANSQVINGIDVDVSISNLPIGGVLAANATAPEENLANVTVAALKDAVILLAFAVGEGRPLDAAGLAARAAAIPDTLDGLDALVADLTRDEPEAQNRRNALDALIALLPKLQALSDQGVPPHEHNITGTAK